MLYLITHHQRSCRFLSVFLKNFIALSFVFRPMIHVELFFMKSIKYVSRFTARLKRRHMYDYTSPPFIFFHILEDVNKKPGKGTATEKVNRSGCGPPSSCPYQTLPPSLGDFGITVSDRGLEVLCPFSTYHLSRLLPTMTRDGPAPETSNSSLGHSLANSEPRPSP